MGTPIHTDDWDDLKTKGATGKVAKLATPVTKDSGQLFSDWVGYGDEYDYKAFTLNSAAKLSLYIQTTGSTPTSAKFTIYQLVESTDKQGNKTYSLKSLQSVSPKYDKVTGKNYVITDPLLLLKGTYYIGIQATNAKKTDSDVNYTISLQNKSAGAFFTKAVNTDDWDDLKEKGAAGKVGAAVTVNASTANIIANNWVGFSDEYDYKAFTLASAAKISLSVTSGTMPDYGKQVIKVGVYALMSNTDKKGVTTYSLKKLQEVSPKYDNSINKYVIDSDALLLDKGTYYIGVQSTNAKKGGGTDYTVALNKSASEFYSTVVTVTASTGNILSDWVGYGDEYDYQAITINSAAKLSLAITSTDAVKISICKLDGKDGKYSFKSLKTTAAKLDKTTNKYLVNTDALLLDKGTYYVCVQSTNAKKAGTKATYTVSLNKTASVFYTKGVNTDDWDDLKEKGAAGKVGKKIASAVTASSGQILSDWVGYGDEYDYQAFTINSAAKLSFTVSATDAAKFTIYELKSSTDKKGVTTYSLGKKQSVDAKYDKNSGKYTVTTNGLLLDKGTYYIGVQSTNAKKGGNADYTVTLNKTASVFYTKGNNNDDWDDLKTKGKAGKVAAAVTVSGSTGQFISDWVGYGDEYDYKAFTLNTAASLSLTISATDAAKFTIYELKSSTDKKGVTTYSLAKKQSVDAKYDKNSGKYTVTTKSLLLDKGTYYLCAQSTNAKKGGSADYTVALNKSGSEFFTKGSANDNAWDAAPALNGTLDKYGELNGSTTGWVGYGDPVDYRTFTTNAANGGGGYYIFDLESKDNSKNNLNLTVYEVVDNKGVKSLKKLKSATASGEHHGVVGAGDKNLLMLKADTKYVVGVEAPGANQAKNGSYELTVYQDQYAHFNMKNNTPGTATKVTAASDVIFTTVTSAAGGDKVDWYDISSFAGTEDLLRLNNAFASLSLKLTFYDRDMRQMKVWVRDLSNDKISEASSVRSNPYGFDFYFGYCTDMLKYMSVEATGTVRSSYLLASWSL